MPSVNEEEDCECNQSAPIHLPEDLQQIGKAKATENSTNGEAAGNDYSENVPVVSVQQAELWSAGDGDSGIHVQEPNQDEEEDVEEEEVFTLAEFLKEQTESQALAEQVLGPCNAEVCSYDKGYMNRQALFACSTCCDLKEAPAGVCLACSLRCHDGHELYELHTKRSFRCDCGNSKFGGSLCCLWPGKEKENVDNSYNQNFQGLYCVCKRPYPDVEAGVLEGADSDMIQCTVCEDWFHVKHLVGMDEVARGDVVCQICAEKFPFLAVYHANAQETEETGVNESSEGNESSITAAENKAECKLKTLQAKLNKRDESPKALLFQNVNSWRKDFCKCEECLNMYKELKCAFLLDEADCYSHYVYEGEESEPTETSADDQTTAFLNTLDRTVALEVVYGFQFMKDELIEYLKKFAENGKVVREEDVKEFLEKLKSNKRQKPLLPPGHCR